MIGYHTPLLKIEWMKYGRALGTKAYENEVLFDSALTFLEITKGIGKLNFQS